MALKRGRSNSLKSSGLSDWSPTGPGSAYTKANRAKQAEATKAAESAGKSDKKDAKKKGKRPMGAAGRLCKFLGMVVLAVLLVASGFLVCAVPTLPTKEFAQFNDEPAASTAFEKSDLVNVALATRDYSFGSHDKQALYKAIYDANMNEQQARKDQGRKTDANAPKVSKVEDPTDTDQLEAVFSDASDTYVYTSDIMSHLDDCYAIAMPAYATSAALLAVWLVCSIVTGVRGGKRRLGSLFLVAGIVVIVAIVACGAWAAVDFTGFFQVFHQIFFSQTGNWTFSVDSLLIRSLPQGFWMAMGVTWLVTSVILSILSILIGKLLRH